LVYTRHTKFLDTVIALILNLKPCMRHLN